MTWRWRRTTTLLVLALLCMPLITVVCASARAQSATASAAGNEVFAGQVVADILARYERWGAVFVFSSDVLPANARFVIEPPPGEPMQRLQAALATLRLGLRPSQDGKQWLVVSLPSPVQPPQTVPQLLHGQVRDAATGLPLEDVLVRCGSESAQSNAEGHFTLAVNNCRGAVHAQAAGYRPSQQPFPGDLLADPDHLQLPLTPISRLEEVVVVASRYAIHGEAHESVERLDAWRLAHTPELGDDAVRVVNQLPSAATVGLSARPHIRGGAADEMLVLFNQVELLEPFHLKDFNSVFSGLNPAVIRTIDVFTGGFPARYGDRMSAVLDIAPRDDYHGVGGAVSVSLLNIGAEWYAAPEDARQRGVLAVRRGTLDWVSQQLSSSLGEPSYNDVFAQYVWDMDDSHQLDVGVLAFGDHLKVDEIDGDGSSERARSNYDNLYAWAQLARYSDQQSAHRTTFAFGKIDQHRRGSINDADSDESVGFVDDAREFDLWQLAHRTTWNLGEFLSADVGGRLHYQRGRFVYQANADRGDIAAVLGAEDVIARAAHIKVKGPSGGVYGALRAEIIERLFVELGARWDFQSFGDQGANHQEFNPRASLRVDLSEQTRLRVSAGRFSQAEGIHELQVTDGATRYQSPQQANHFIVGLDHAFDEKLEVRLEAFYKDSRRVKRRFDNLFDQLSILPEIAPDRFTVAPIAARAQGVELAITYRPDQQNQWWASYSLAHADDRIEGPLGRRWQPRPWDQRQTIRAGVVLEHEGWSFGGTVVWHSGWRTTNLPVLVNLDEEGEILPVDVVAYGGHLRDYLSMDLRLARTWRWNQDSLEVFAEVTNIADRDNVGAVGYEVDERALVAEREKLIPLIPSLGFTYRFQ